MNGRSLHCALAMSRDKSANDQLIVVASTPAEASSSEQPEGGPLGESYLRRGRPAVERIASCCDNDVLNPVF